MRASIRRLFSRCLLWTFMAVFPVTAANLSVSELKYYDTSDGLLTPSATEIIQTRNGLIWFGHRQGLSYFDGQNFRQFKSHPYDPIQLSDNHINHLKENSEGDLWCRTQDGNLYLFRMAGMTFNLLTELKQRGGKLDVKEIYPLEKGHTWISDRSGRVFRLDDRNPSAPPLCLQPGAEEIYHIFQWKDEEWLLSSEGAKVFNEADGSLETPEGLDSVPYRFFAQDNDTLWLADGRNGCCKIHAEGIERLQLPGDNDFIRSMSRLDTRELAFCRNRSLLFYDPDRNRFRTETFVTADTLKNVHCDSKGHLWVTESNGSLWLLNRKHTLKQHFEQPASAPFFHTDLPSTFVFEDMQAQTWIVFQNGCLCYYDNDSHELIQYFGHSESGEFQFAPNIQAFLYDRQGNFWFGDRQSFGMIHFHPNAYELISTTFPVRAVLNDSKGRLWVASVDWCVRLFDHEQRLIGYLSQDGSIQTEKCPFFDHLCCLMEDSKGRIWAGSRTQGLFILQENAGNTFRVRQYRNDSGDASSLSDNAVFDLLEDSRGNVWIATFQGGLNLAVEEESGRLSFIHAKSGQWEEHYPSEMQCLRCLYEDRGIILAGGGQGLLSFSNRFQDAGDIRFYHSTHLADDNHSLSDNDLTYIFRPAQGDLYFLTQKGGINRFCGKELLMDSLKMDEVFNELNSLESDMTLSMTEDPDGRLWVTSKHCLSRFEPESRRFVHFKQDYFEGTPFFSEGRFGRLKDGRLMFGVSQGLLLIRPELLEPSRYVPPIYLSELRIEDEVMAQDIDREESVVIRPKAHYFCIHFSALDYQDTHNIRYTYRLNKLGSAQKDSAKWHEWQEAGSAEFPNLNPGQYVLDVRSTNGDGVAVDNTRSIRINVKPTFRQTLAAKILGLLLILLIGYGIGQIVFSFLKMRSRIAFEKELSDIKLKFYTDISHELRTPLTLIESPVSELLEHESLSDSARRYLTLVKKNADRMLETVNQLLDFRKIQNRKMNMLVEETDLLSFTENIMDYFRHTAEEHRMDFRIDSDESHPYVWIDRNKVEKIIFNLLSNAFKYTDDGKSVHLYVGEEGGRPFVTVTDQGVGISMSQQERIFMSFETAVKQKDMPSSGIGLALVKELVDMHHAEIQLFSRYGHGSEFKVLFQAGRKHFEDDPQVEFLLNDGQKAEGSGEPVQPTEETRNDKEYSLLIVEDNAELRSFIRDILSQQYCVFEAADGLEGLEKAREWMPDMIISDIMMPRMDGWKMVGELKKDGRVSHIPIVLLTANAGLEDRIDALNEGVDDYLTKPFSSSYLLARIASIFHQRKAWQQNYMNALIEAHIDARMEESPKMAGYDEEFLRKVTLYLKNNIDNPELNMDSFAAELSVSRSVFYSKIKNLLGISPMDFIQQYRIRYASKLIAETDMSISDIAFRCGFNDLGYFGKRFRKQTGFSPSEYRSTNRKA